MEDRFTYGEFVSRVYKLAEGLNKRGIERGDRIAILHQNCHYFLEAYYAAAVIGAILCPLNYRLSAREVAFILEDTDAKAMIAQPMFAALVRESLEKIEKEVKVYWTSKGQPPEGGELIETIMEGVTGAVEAVNISEDDIAQLYYTSGTTGRQKGVMLTHKNVAYHALGTIAELKMTDEDRWIHVAPMFHLADAWATWAVTWVGGTHIMVPEFDVKKVMALMEDERVTLTNMIPTMLNLMVNDPEIKKHDFSSLRVMLSGGAPIAPEVVRKIMEAFGCDYIQTYGMTETAPYLTMSILKDYLKERPEEEQFKFKAATGRPVMFVQLKVVHENGTEVTWDGKEVGEIVVNGTGEAVDFIIKDANNAFMEITGTDRERIIGQPASRIFKSADLNLDIFHRVVAQSGAFQFSEDMDFDWPFGGGEAFLHQVVGQVGPLPDIDWYLECGTLEWLRQSNVNLAEALRARGVRASLKLRHAGHNWVNWSNGIAAGLRAVLGDRPGDLNPRRE